MLSVLSAILCSDWAEVYSIGEFIRRNLYVFIANPLREPAWLGNNGLGSACEDAILFDGDWSKWPSEIVGYSRLSVNLFK